MPRDERKGGRFDRSTRKIGEILARISASIVAIVSAAGLVVSGLLLVLAGLVVMQQALSRISGLDVQLGDLFRTTSRMFSSLASAVSR